MRSISKSIARPTEAPKPRLTDPRPQRFGRWRSLALSGDDPKVRRVPSRAPRARRVSMGSLVAWALLTTTAQAELDDSGAPFPARKYESGAKPEVVAIGDMNQDGIGDLVVGNSTGFGTKLRVFLGNGDGTVSLFAAYLSGIIRDLDLVDLDGDGDLDVVVATQFGGVEVRRGAGNGALGPPLVTVFGEEPWSVVATDLNGNGIPDLAVVDRWEDNVHVLLGAGDATFGTPTAFACGVDPMSIAAGDLNGDTVPDLVIGNSGSGDTSILLGLGDGTFGPASALATGPTTRAVALEDFNEDGLLDLAVLLNAFNDVTSVYLGFGNGTFGPPLDLPIPGSAPFGLVTSDFDQDGHVDLAASSASVAVVLLGQGDGSFDPAVSYPSAAKQGLAAGDLNGDGFPDLAIADLVLKDVTVMIGAGDGTFRGHELLYAGTTIERPQRADMNGDGRADLVYTNDQGLWVSPGAGDGNYGPEVLVGADMQGEYVLDDLNGDGIVDVVIATETNTHAVLVALGLGDGTLAPATPYLPLSFPEHPIVGDFDGDAILDVVVWERVGDHLAFLKGNGDGSFAAPTFPAPLAPSDMAAADVDNDQRLDLVILDFNDSARVMLGNGDGTFAPDIVSVIGPGNTNPTRLQVADFNGDGNVDLGTAGYQSEDARILFGDGTGSFGLPTVFALDSRPSGQGVADVNADGAPDFVVATNADVVFTVLGNANGPMTATSYVLPANAYWDLLLEDVDEDGSIDIGADTITNQGLVVLFNQHTTSGPSTYCTPKTSSAGCITTIVASSTKAPTSGSGDFTIDATNVQEGMNGLLFTSLSGAAALPFNGGTLCMNPPLKRGPIMNAGGSMPGGCAGSFTTTVNDGLMIPMGLDAGPGGQAHYQYFYRDPQNGAGNFGSALSDAIEVCFL